MALPGVEEALDGFAFTVLNKGKAKGFAYAWNERVHPKKPKVANPEVLIVVVRNLTEKEILMSSDPNKYFSEPHYDGYAAIHIHLDSIELDELEDHIIEAWKCKAPPESVAQFFAS